MKTLVAIFNPTDMSVVAVVPSDSVPDPTHIPDPVVGRTAEIFTNQDDLLKYLQGRKTAPLEPFQEGLRLARLLALVRGEMRVMGVQARHVVNAYDELLGEVFDYFDVPTIRCAYCGEPFPSCTEKRDTSGGSVCPECWEPEMVR